MIIVKYICTNTRLYVQYIHTCRNCSIGCLYSYSVSLQKTHYLLQKSRFLFSFQLGQISLFVYLTCCIKTTGHPLYAAAGGIQILEPPNAPRWKVSQRVKDYVALRWQIKLSSSFSANFSLAMFCLSFLLWPYGCRSQTLVCPSGRVSGPVVRGFAWHPRQTQQPLWT